MKSPAGRGSIFRPERQSRVCAKGRTDPLYESVEYEDRRRFPVTLRKQGIPRIGRVDMGGPAIPHTPPHGGAWRLMWRSRDLPDSEGLASRFLGADPHSFVDFRKKYFPVSDLAGVGRFLYRLHGFFGQIVR